MTNQSTPPKAAPMREDVTQANVKQTLEWYAKHVGNCRKMTQEGEDSRQELNDDCGKRAKAALKSRQFCRECLGTGMRGQFNTTCTECVK